MFRELKNYIIDNEFKITMFDNKVNVVNYNDIITIEKNRISLRYSRGIIIVKGCCLTLKKLLDNEILIAGDIKSVELE